MVARDGVCLLVDRAKEAGELLREGAGERDKLAAAGMEKAEADGVQALPREAGDALFRAVHRVAHDGVPQIRHVHANLMCAPRL